ncbi:MAG: hypothetical protein K2X53_06360, partial [Alphaproteobacteria bacterium]|nr:hypothetical protein [Alphaproteobacteria bacterium]
VTYVETRLKIAVDASAIAGARYDLATVQQTALRFFKANFPDGFMNITATPVVTVLNNNSRVRVAVNTTVPAILGLIIGTRSYNISTATEVDRQTTRLEVAMVLDTTGSMFFDNKIQSLRTAASNFIDVLSGVATNTQQLNPTIYISLTPYVAGVNIGTNRTAWLSDPATVTGSFPSRVPWQGCVYARTDLNEETDVPNVRTKWPTYFTASTYVRNRTSYNDYVVNSNGTITVMSVPNSTPRIDIGPNRSCGLPIVPLTNNYNALKAAISNLKPVGGGGTLSNIGLAWGWRTISPNWTGAIWGWGGSVDPVPYNTPNTRKSLVIMTDGMNNIGNEPSAYGLVREGKLGTTNISQAINVVNARMATVCSNIKAQGIDVYTITFMQNDSTIQGLMRSCASRPDWYFNAQSGSDLNTYFQNIANIIQRIRVTL